MANDKNKDLIAQMATEFAEELKKGGNPFAHIAHTNPMNMISGKHYTGFNRIYMAMAGKKKGYLSSKWLTFNQAKALDGTVRKGEKSEPVFFWGMVWSFSNDVVVYDCKNVEEAVEAALKKGSHVTASMLVRKTPFIKSFAVFNIEQCDGIEYELELNTPTHNIQELLALVPTINGSGLPQFDGENLIIPTSFNWDNAEELLLPIGEWACRTIEDVTFAEKGLIGAITSAFLASATGIKAPTVSIEVAAEIADALVKTPMTLYHAATKAEKAASEILSQISIEAAA